MNKRLSAIDDARWLRQAAATVLLLLTAACGGGGGGSGNDAPPGQITARAGSAEIGPDGGSVDAVLEGGATVVLDVPKGALKRAVTVRIDPKAASDSALGAFTVGAIDVPLLEPATLVVTLPQAAGTDTGLVLHFGARKFVVGEPPAGRRLELTLGRFGLVPESSGPAAAGRKMALTGIDDAYRDALHEINSAAELDLSVEARLTANERFSYLIDAVRALMGQPTVERALAVQLAAESALVVPGLFDNAFNRDILRDWRDALCPEQRFAENALNGYDGVDAVSFRRLAVAAVTWTKLAIDQKELVQRIAPFFACAELPADHRDPLRARLPAFRERLERALNLIDARSGYDQIAEVRLPELFQFEEVLQQFDAGGSILDIIGRQTVRLRAAAWADCRESRQQGRQIKLLQLETGSEVFAPASPFEARDLRADYQLCGVPLGWQLRNSLGQTLDSGSAGGIAAGEARRRVTIISGGAESLVLRGPLRPLHCGPNPPQINNEDLLIRVGHEVGNVVEARRVTWTDEAYLDAPMTLDLDQLRAAAATIASTGAIRVELIREGALCPHALVPIVAHEVLVTLVLDFVGVSIETTSLPNATVGAAYSRRLEAVGGRLPYAWTARNLPAGLQIDSSTGTIFGTPTQAGTFTIGVDVQTADLATASRDLTLTVSIASVAGRYVGTRTDLSPGSEGSPRPYTADVQQSGSRIAVRRVNSFDGTVEPLAEVFDLAADGTLTFLGLNHSRSGFTFTPLGPDGPSYTGTLAGDRLRYQWTSRSGDAEAYDLVKQ